MMAGFIFFVPTSVGKNEPKAHHGCNLAPARAFHGYTGEKEGIFHSVYPFVFAIYHVLITTFRTLLLLNKQWTAKTDNGM
jgi:hypothetical protein